MKNSMIEAFELKRQGYYKQAIEIYYKLLSDTTDNIEILSELAELYLLMKNHSRAMHYINKVLELNPNHTQGLNILKQIFLANHEFDKAIDVAKKIYELERSDFTLLSLFELLYDQRCYDEICNYDVNLEQKECVLIKARSLYKLKKYDEAKIILENNIDKSNELELLLLGKIYYKKGMQDETKEVCKKLKNIDLKDSESLNFAGLNYLEELDLDKAIECLKKAIALKEDVAKYHYNIGQAYFLKGWIEEAQKSFNNAICINPTEENYHYSLAYLLYRVGDYENALMHLDDSDNTNSKILKLIIKAEQGNLATPKVELEKMLKDNPNNETILFSLAKIYFKLDMFKQSKTIMHDVMCINQKSFEYQEFYIKLLLQLEDLETAKDNITNLIAKYPKYYYAKVLEAEYYVKTKNFDELFETAQDLIELDINHYEGYYYNALALFEKEDVNFAIESLKKAITLDVNNAELYVKMGEFYQAIGRYDDAFEYIKEASDIDKSAKNKELYVQLSSIVRKRHLSSD